MSRLLPATAALVLLALGAAATPAGAASTQLSDGLPFSDIEFRLHPPQISPDGGCAVYRQDAVTDGASELWSVPVAGGAPVRLSDVLLAGPDRDLRDQPRQRARRLRGRPGYAGQDRALQRPDRRRRRSTKLNHDARAPTASVIEFRDLPDSDRVYLRRRRATFDHKYRALRRVDHRRRGLGAV